MMGFPIETIVEQDFIWCKVSEAFVPKDETVVDVANVTDKQVVVGKELTKGGGPDFFTDRDHH